MHTDVATRIQQLSPSVINKIAAGEVIERPASVVKELLENSLDALATRIEVDIEQGGTELIRVVDDGEGIHPDDIRLAVASHATSKILAAEDLFHVRTMGFRGEALASISEVSQFRIRSKQADQDVGTEMEVHGGEIQQPKACGCPDGTQIEVRQLFFNTPVRRKFMRRHATEFGHISEQFTRIALANPNLHMVLRHNGKTVYELPATHHLHERLELFFGSELAEQLIHIEGEASATDVLGEGTSTNIRLWGYVAHPSKSKGTRKGQYLFLNGRWIQDRSLQHALTEAYRGLVMVGRYPIGYLFLELSPDMVDVNVHPTKSEVRFVDSQVLFRLILSTLRNKFLSMDLDSTLDIRRVAEDQSQLAAASPKELQRDLVEWAQRSAPSHTSPPGTFQDSVKLANLLSQQSTPDFQPYPQTAEESLTRSTNPVRPEKQQDSPRDPDQNLHPKEIRAMQVHDCYLVVETTDGITVIDQHALHERIMYEHLRRRVLDGSVEVQKLLMPITVELSSREAHTLLDHADLLTELGLHVEDFGGSTVALTAYPTLMAKAEPKRLLRDLVELLEGSSRKLERRDLIDSLLHMMSCKAAIKAGQRLTLEEMESLLAQRHLCDDHHHCPHGRPTALKLTRDELDRQFGRLG